MENPLVKKDLIDAILELRQEVERRLQTNRYYVAMHKLDELLAAIRPLEVIEATAAPEESESVTPEPEADKTWASDEPEKSLKPSWPSGAEASGDEPSGDGLTAS